MDPSVTAEITAVLTKCYKGMDNKEFDAIAVKDSLCKLLQREDAWSIYISIVPGAKQDSTRAHMYLQKSRGRHTFGIKTYSAKYGKRNLCSER